MVKEDFLVYESGTSLLHRANPLLKLILLVVLAAFFSGAEPSAVLAASAALPVLVVIAGIRPSRILGGSLFVGALILSFGVLSLINLDTKPLALSFATEGIVDVLLYLGRIMVIYFYNALFYSTTSLSELRRALSRAEDRLFPGLPQSRRLSLSLMLFLKFIPLCIAEWHELDRAWASRCGPTGVRRLYALVPKFIMRMLRKAGDIACALSNRALS